MRARRGENLACSRNITVHKKDTKSLHRWIGFRNDRQSLPVCCWPDQILCQGGVQRNGSNAGAKWIDEGTQILSPGNRVDGARRGHSRIFKKKHWIALKTGFYRTIILTYPGFQ